MIPAATIEVTVDFGNANRSGGYIVEVAPEGGQAIGKWSASGSVNAEGSITYEQIPPGKYVVTGRPNPGADKDRTEPQTIDLPGGNQRFATFEFGLDLDRPAFAPVALPPRIPLDQPTVVSAVLRGLEPGELREMWLHVRNGDGTWRRTAMTMLKASDGVVGVGVFPITAFDAKGRTSWYASAVATVGDEYYTEISSIESVPR